MPLQLPDPNQERPVSHHIPLIPNTPLSRFPDITSLDPLPRLSPLQQAASLRRLHIPRYHRPDIITWRPPDFPQILTTKLLVLPAERIHDILNIYLDFPHKQTATTGAKEENLIFTYPGGTEFFLYATNLNAALYTLRMNHPNPDVLFALPSHITETIQEQAYNRHYPLTEDAEDFEHLAPYQPSNGHSIFTLDGPQEPRVRPIPVEPEHVLSTSDGQDYFLYASDAETLTENLTEDPAIPSYPILLGLPVNVSVNTFRAPAGRRFIINSPVSPFDEEHFGTSV